MRRFPVAHAAHPQWDAACDQVVARLRHQMAQRDVCDAPTLGLLYISDHFAAFAQEMLDHLAAALPEIADWSGTVGVGIAAGHTEYFDQPALAVMLCELPAASYRVFSGVAPLATAAAHGFEAHTALVHADAGTPDVAELIAELASRTTTGYLFGGLSSSRAATVQFASSGSGNMRGQGRAGGVFSGGLSGVAFSEAVALVSRVTQGCAPVGALREVTACEDNVLTRLDGEPALEALLADVDASLERPRDALEKVRATLVGLTGDGDDAVLRAGSLGSDVVVRHIVGLDPSRQGVAIASPVQAGMRAAFCRRDAVAAQADLVRICTEIREELEPDEILLPTAVGGGAADAAPLEDGSRRIAGAVYVSCAGRGGPHFGAPDAELQIVRRALGDVPLVGFFAGGEIARHHLYGYTGVLTVFTASGAAP